MAQELAVWLYGTLVATVEQERRRLRLSYTKDALHQYPLGFPLLSLSLPLTRRRYAHNTAHTFLDGLLPEGETRRVIANDFDVASDDTYGLISALGRDCAGALVIQPANESPPKSPTTATAEPLSDAGIVDLITNLRAAPLGVEDNIRVSLAGVQEKLVLTRMPDGAWGRPVEGTPSTHILKPEIRGYANTVENEFFCMRIAKHLDLPVADVEMTTFGNHTLIVVQRYDRIVHADGSVERIHQEDFCQATETPPNKKYEGDGGPRFRRIAEILSSIATAGSVETLLRALTLNIVLGNGDAHAKNFSLLHQPDGTLELAPLYDLMCTLFYGDDRLAMYIDDVQRTQRVGLDRIFNEAARWGMSHRRAEEVVVEILDRIPDAIAAAADKTPDLPAEIPDLLESQLSNIHQPAGDSV